MKICLKGDQLSVWLIAARLLPGLTRGDQLVLGAQHGKLPYLTEVGPPIFDVLQAFGITPDQFVTHARALYCMGRMLQTLANPKTYRFPYRFENDSILGWDSCELMQSGYFTSDLFSPLGKELIAKSRFVALPQNVLTKGFIAERGMMVETSALIESLQSILQNFSSQAGVDLLHFQGQDQQNFDHEVLISIDVEPAVDTELSINGPNAAAKINIEQKKELVTQSTYLNGYSEQTSYKKSLGKPAGIHLQSQDFGSAVQAEVKISLGFHHLMSSATQAIEIMDLLMPFWGKRLLDRRYLKLVSKRIEPEISRLNDLDRYLVGGCENSDAIKAFKTRGYIGNDDYKIVGHRYLNGFISELDIRASRCNPLLIDQKKVEPLLAYFQHRADFVANLLTNGDRENS